MTRPLVVALERGRRPLICFLIGVAALSTARSARRVESYMQLWKLLVVCLVGLLATAPSSVLSFGTGALHSMPTARMQLDTFSSATPATRQGLS